MFGKSVGAQKRLIRLQDGTMWDPDTALPPDVQTVLDRNGPAGTPIGSPLNRVPNVQGGRPLSGRSPLTLRGARPANPYPVSSGRLPGSEVPDGTTAAYEAAQRAAAGGPGGVFGNVVAQAAPTAPQVAPMPSRTGDDWGDEAEAPHALALPSGRTVAPIGNVVAGGDQNGPALANGFTIKPRFFDEGGTGQRLAGILGPALMTLGGNPQGAQQMIQLQHRQRELKQERARQGQQDQFERDKFAWQRRKDMRPEIRSAGRSVVSVPFEGDPLVLYSDPSEADRYASALGLQPGDDGYDEAVQDYVLKGYGPTAMGGKKTFEDIRYDNRKGLRGLPTYRDLHPRPTGGGGGGGRRAYDPNRPPRTTGEAVAPIVAKMARGEALTQGERAALATYGRRGGARLPDMTPAPNAPAPRGEPVRVNTPAQARALPKGTVFVTPDGKQKVR